MTPPRNTVLLLVTLALVGASSVSDSERHAYPPPSPKPANPPGTVLFHDDFADGDLEHWRPDRSGVWTVKRGMLRADLPDQKQQHSFIFAGMNGWVDYAVDLDVCAMRGVDKGVIVRATQGESGIGVDLRGPGYQDLLLHRRQWPIAKVGVVNGNGAWHHLRVEARGHRYRVWVNGEVVLDKVDSKKSRPQGGIALAAYTGGVGECTVYYDNVHVTAIPAGDEVGALPLPGNETLR